MRAARCYILSFDRNNASDLQDVLQLVCTLFDRTAAGGVDEIANIEHKPMLEQQLELLKEVREHKASRYVL